MQPEDMTRADLERMVRLLSEECDRLETVAHARHVDFRDLEDQYHTLDEERKEQAAALAEHAAQLTAMQQIVDAERARADAAERGAWLAENAGLRAPTRGDVIAMARRTGPRRVRTIETDMELPIEGGHRQHVRAGSTVIILPPADAATEGA